MVGRGGRQAEPDAQRRRPGRSRTLGLNRNLPAERGSDSVAIFSFEDAMVRGQEGFEDVLAS